MSAELERLAKIDSPRLPAVFAKALDAGEIHVDDLRRLLKLRAREYKRDGETAEQSYAKSFTGLSPRDTVGAELFAKLVTMEKAAPAVNQYGGQGVRTSGANSYTAMMANRDNNYLQQMIDVPKKQRMKIAELSHRAGISLAEAKRQIMGA